MKLTKDIPATTKTIRFKWCQDEFMEMSDVYRKIRSKFRNKMDKCGWCSYPFINGEMMALAQPFNGRNMVLCQGCADVLSAQTRG